jgi:hypothetical protein
MTPASTSTTPEALDAGSALRLARATLDRAGKLGVLESEVLASVRAAAAAGKVMLDLPLPAPCDGDRARILSRSLRCRGFVAEELATFHNSEWKYQIHIEW